MRTIYKLGFMAAMPLLLVACEKKADEPAAVETVVPEVTENIVSEDAANVVEATVDNATESSGDGAQGGGPDK